jgi:hypothetical protein
MVNLNRMMQREAMSIENTNDDSRAHRRRTDIRIGRCIEVVHLNTHQHNFLDIENDSPYSYKVLDKSTIVKCNTQLCCHVYLWLRLSVVRLSNMSIMACQDDVCITIEPYGMTFVRYSNSYDMYSVRLTSMSSVT